MLLLARLPVEAELVPVGRHLLTDLTVEPRLLTLSHAALDCPAVADLLPFGRAIVRLHTVGTHLLPLGDPVLPLHVLVAVRHTSIGPLRALRTRLLAFGYAAALHPLGALRPCLVTLGALRMLRVLGPLGHEMPGVLDTRRVGSLTLRARDMAAAASALHLSALAAATALLGDGSMAILTPTAVGPRTCRGCDRKRCDARCEKHPGHH